MKLWMAALLTLSCISKTHPLQCNEFLVKLALVAFLVLHIIAQQTSQVPRTPNLQALGGIVLQQYVHIFAMLLQFVIPTGFLIGAVISFIKQ